MWPETKRVMAENWPDPSLASKNAVWDVVQTPGKRWPIVKAML
jgi:hypothetical protein